VAGSGGHHHSGHAATQPGPLAAPEVPMHVAGIYKNLNMSIFCGGGGTSGMFVRLRHAA